MSKAMIGVLLCAALAAGAGAVRARAEEDSGPVRELPAGTVLPDGTVAGEVQAFNYFKANEPELYSRLRALEPAGMREHYGKYFGWFQRVGNYRKRQKREMIRQLKNELQIRDLSEGLRRSPGADAAARERLRRAVEDAFDSDLKMLELELTNTQGALDELKDEVAELTRRVEERRRNKAAIIEKRLRELETADAR